MDDLQALDRVVPKDRYQRRTAGGERSPAVPAVPVTGTSDVVQVLPSRCPYCGRTRVVALAVLQETAVAGQSPAGYPCTHTVRRRVQCDHCRGVFASTSYERRVLPGQ